MLCIELIHMVLEVLQPDDEGHDEDKGGEEEGRQRQDPAPDPHSTSPAVFAIPTSAVIS